jgi:hypothetical protein
MNDKIQADRSALKTTRSMLDSIRQWFFPAEFRIAPPSLSSNIATVTGDRTGLHTVEPEQPLATSVDPQASNRFVAEVATCLWYLKTKHFKQCWADDGSEGNSTDDDPRVRRAIGRLNRGIDALRESGIEIEDPTNKRYPPGSEGMMRPLQFQPTAGITFETVTETVAPIVYRNGQLIQRGEVFVAVPRDDASAGVGVSTSSAQVVGLRGEDNSEDKLSEGAGMGEPAAGNQDAGDATGAAESVEAPRDTTDLKQNGGEDPKTHTASPTNQN